MGQQVTDKTSSITPEAVGNVLTHQLAQDWGHLGPTIHLSWKRHRCQINFSSAQKHKELTEKRMKEVFGFAPSIGGTCRLQESRAAKASGMDQLPKQDQVPPGHGGARQITCQETQQDLTNKSSKSLLPHLQFAGISGTNIWQVSSLQSVTSFSYCAHPGTLKGSPAK